MVPSKKEGAAMASSPTSFAKYASSLDLSDINNQRRLVETMTTSFALLASIDPDSYSINLDLAKTLPPLVYNQTTNTLEQEKQDYSFFATLLSLIGFASQPEDGKENLYSMVIVTAEKISKLAKVKLGDEESWPFGRYLIKNYGAISHGITYCKERERLQNPNSREKNPSEVMLSESKELFEGVVAAATLIEEATSLDKSDLLHPYIPTKKVNKILSLPLYAILKEIMQLKMIFGDTKVIEKMLFDKAHLRFLGLALLIDPALYPICLSPLLTQLKIIQKNPFSDEEASQFYLLLFKEPAFSALQGVALQKILRMRTVTDTDEVFNKRYQSEPVQAALRFIAEEIQRIKKETLSDIEKKTKLQKFLEPFLFHLASFPPYRKPLHFVSPPMFETTDENNPGLPFVNIGSPEITRFFLNVLLRFENLNNIDLSSKDDRKALLECAEFLIEKNVSSELKDPKSRTIDLDALEKWLPLFPEVKELATWPLVQKFIESRKEGPPR